jgi:hypothetical protein
MDVSSGAQARAVRSIGGGIETLAGALADGLGFTLKAML